MWQNRFFTELQSNRVIGTEWASAFLELQKVQNRPGLPTPIFESKANSHPLPKSSPVNPIVDPDDPDATPILFSYENIMSLNNYIQQFIDDYEVQNGAPYPAAAQTELRQKVFANADYYLSRMAA